MTEQQRNATGESTAGPCMTLQRAIPPAQHRLHLHCCETGSKTIWRWTLDRPLFWDLCAIADLATVSSRKASLRALWSPAMTLVGTPIQHHPSAITATSVHVTCHSWTGRFWRAKATPTSSLMSPEQSAQCPYTEAVFVEEASEYTGLPTQMLILEKKQR